MAVNLNIQADVIDIRVDTPQQDDIFLVDTNVWFWQTYTNAGFGAKPYQIKNYPNYLKLALSNRATLSYSGLILAELAHIIEKTEYEIYIQSYGRVPIKEYRHNYPVERANVVAEVQLAWSQVKALAVPVNLTVDDATTDAALNRFKSQAVDGYDLLLLEAISRAEAGQVKIITDDMDYTVVPGIQVFTSNNNVVQEAAIQNKLVVR
ncbi:MAG: hypothetical protein KME38_26155 [Spirirestis rafaelensis WJT71-NPBG6]|jgi:hypothetical protein|nr:hypothetical protein [Spirirestis rafaelensis WJT71-NPBG6]